MEFLEMGNLSSSIVSIIVIIVAIIVFKKVASCLAKVVVFIILMAILLFAYLNNVNEEDGERVFIKGKKSLMTSLLAIKRRMKTEIAHSTV